ncbi:MAG: O-antigen ligase family protein [Nitrospirales bacterium]|nr:O-antigen ligase family protein [Nitrospirales bacterium]
MNVRSSIALFVTSALLCFSPLLDGGTTHLAQMIIRLLILTWLGLVAAEGIRTGVFIVPKISSEYPVLSFVGLAIVSTLLAPYSHPARNWLLTIALYVALFYLLVSFVDRWEHVFTLTCVIVLMGTGEAVFAIVQSVRWGAARPSGTFFNPNFLAGYLSVTWSLLLSYGVYGYRQAAIRVGMWRHPFLWWGVFGLMFSSVLYAVILTQSRGGLLVLFAATLFVLICRYGWARAGACGALLVLVGILLPSPARERALAEHLHNPAAYARWQMWQGAFKQMVDHPLGIGLGLYQYTYPGYAFPIEGEIARYGKVAQTPHNDYLQIGVEMGGAAILVVFGGIYTVTRDLWRVVGRRLRRGQRSLMVGLGGAATALLLHAAFDSSLREPALAILLVLCCALITAAGRMSRKGTAAAYVIGTHPRAIWAIGIACAVVVVSVELVRFGMAWSTFESASRHAVNGKLHEAAEGLKRAIAWDPDKSLYHHGLGSVYTKQFEVTAHEQDFLQAKREFERAIELNPLDSRVFALLAQLYLTAAQSSHMSSDEQRRALLAGSARLYEETIRLAPFSAVYRYEQARVYWLMGNWKKAERRAQEAQELEPNFLPARAFLARMWAKEGRMEEAGQQLREIHGRQVRYQSVRKDSLDQAFLSVDVNLLRPAVNPAGALR